MFFTKPPSLSTHPARCAPVTNVAMGLDGRLIILIYDELLAISGSPLSNIVIAGIWVSVTKL